MENCSSGLLSVPIATYRLQFNSDFGFDAARRVLPYLRDLGISHVYASPYFKAREGSPHGYDITDHNSLNAEVGTREEYDAFIEEMRKLGMGQILDIVPNHMCVESSDNRWWFDVLENGSSSPYASFFDIDWDPVKQELKNKVLIPVLGDQYGAVLENGELRLAYHEGAFYLYYYDHKFPIIPKTYVSILSCRLAELDSLLGEDNPHYQELLSIMTALEHLPPYTEADHDRIIERYREKEIIKRRLCSLYRESAQVGEFIDGNVRIFNGEKGDPRSFDHLDELLRQQVFRLSHWRVATEEINYRRFFDINSLGAIRMEDPAVFAECHRMIFELISEGAVTGLRIDHIDGLYDPAEYLDRLQFGCYLNKLPSVPELQNGPGTEGNGVIDEQARVEAEIRKKYQEILAFDPNFKAFYIVGEKILAKGEKLPEDWPIFGTTGYGFMNSLNGLFVDSANGKAFDALYCSFTGCREKFPQIEYEKKKLVMQASMSSEVNTLGHYLNTISEMDRQTRDFTLNSLIKALVEVIAFFPVYRTYSNSFAVSERDRQYIDYAVAKARRHNPATNASIFEFIRDVLQLRFYDRMEDADKRDWLDFVMRFQQITGPVMAKGVEDTTFYVYSRLVSLNEVGGNPERFGVAIEAFHGQNIERWKSRPLRMLATSTHDTKRGEDVRARINVLSEIPETWKASVQRWSRLNRKVKMLVDGRPVPDRNEEYLLYQTLVGAWPTLGQNGGASATFRQRIREYMLKAVREAKVNTSWINPDSAYEDALLYFIDMILASSRANRFLDDFSVFQALIDTCGMFNSLSQTLLKITSPGVPDFYQGSELWDLNLVDPDNRRPVDYDLRQRLLDNLKRAESSTDPIRLVRDLLVNMTDGKVKLYLIRKALFCRNGRRDLFESGRYLPLEAIGAKADNICAFERSLDMDAVIVVAPRFFTRLVRGAEGLPLGSEAWTDTRIVTPFEIPGTRYRNIFTGEIVTSLPKEDVSALNLADVLKIFPVALLERI
ncbi:MAG: malto-oligosyltrehalose synthase [Geobacteraceae bacterium]|nr:malto-oligosyltrehalose synthase [Geobacteraceae bacterium]